MTTSAKRAATPKQMAALQRAKEAREAITQSPAERHLEKLKLVVKWTHGWGITTAKLLCQAANVKHPGFITSAVKEGLVRIQKTPSGVFYLLTLKGFDWLKTIVPENDPLLKVPMMRKPGFGKKGFDHMMTVQAVLAQSIHEHDGIRYWLTERQLKATMIGSSKIPDAYYDCGGLGDTYIEVELTKKYDSELDRMLIGLMELKRDHQGISNVRIYTKPSFVNHYVGRIDALLENGKYPLWEQAPGGRYYVAAWIDLEWPDRDSLEEISVYPLDKK